jgi:homoserine dehydrogenase
MIKIGILGFGFVGQGTAYILIDNKSMIETRTGQTIEISKILVRSPEKYAHKELHGARLCTDANDILNDPEISIVIELMGGEYPAYDYICHALKNKKHVVTANKEVVSKHKTTFFKLAKDNHVSLCYEAAVAGAIPIIRSLKIGLAGNIIGSFSGILNGTTNYILTKMEEDKKEFQSILKTAQTLGLAEADPTMDIEGIDAAHKLVILAAVAFKVDVNLCDIYHEGISKIKLKDIETAKELGYSIKLLAIGKQLPENTLSLRVHPTLVPLTHLLTSIRNEMNAVFVEGHAAGEILLSGKGAGGAPTGSSVVSDIIDIALTHTHKERNQEPDLQKVTVESIQHLHSKYYLRVSIPDQANSLEHLTRCLGKENISIKKIIQKETANNTAEVTFITYPTQESIFLSTVKKINALEDTHIKNWIRVL